MPPAPIFARVQPKSLEITEKYNYQMETGNPTPQPSPGTEEKPNPAGSIAFAIPHDGKDYFTKQTLGDLHRQQGKIWAQSDPAAQVGYLGFAGYGRTDLGALLDLSVKHDVVPLTFLLQAPGLPRVSKAEEAGKLVNYQQVSKIEYTYQPKPPTAIPVQLTTKYFDENPLSDLKQALTSLFTKRELKKKENTNRRAQKIISGLTQTDSFLPDLVFEFQLKLHLAAPVGKENDDDPPQLDRIMLHWPVTLSPQHLALQVDNKEHRALYNPTAELKDPNGVTRGALEWRNVTSVAPAGKSPETGLFVYQTPLMQLAIKQPGELYQEKSLNGKLTVKLNRSLSGLQLQLFTATGEQSAVVPKFKTEITLDFSIRLANYPGTKIYSPYQHLQFEGVVLDESRVMNVKNLLDDLGFSTEYRWLENSTSYQRYFVLEGKKQQGLQMLYLWILLEGTAGQTLRSTDVQGYQSYSTRLEAGHTRLYMRGQFSGDKDLLLPLMQEIQCKLRSLFRHVSSVD